MVMTLDEIESFRLACDEYRSVGEEDSYTLEEVQSHWPYSETDACSFVVMGFPVQIWLNFEQELNRAAEHTNTWRELARSYARQLIEQYNIVVESSAKLEKQLSEK